MQANTRRKLIMSIGAAVMTACCLTSTTYAWFARNSEAWTEDVDFKVETTVGLTVSIDDTYYYQNIDKSSIEKQIVKNSGRSLNELKYTGVTLKHDANGKIVYETNNGVKRPLFEKDSIILAPKSSTYDATDISSIRISSGKITIEYFDSNTATVLEKPYTTYSVENDGTFKVDGTSYGSVSKLTVKTYSIDKNNLRVEYKDSDPLIICSKSELSALNLHTIENNNFYINKKNDVKVLVGKEDTDSDENFIHQMTAAESYDYVTFDLYFKLNGMDSDRSDFRLYFTNDRTSIKGSSEEVVLQNGMTTYTKSYIAGEKVTVNPADAMRIGVINQTEQSSLKVFEPTIGLGSSAIEGSADNTHDKSKNAMYTYYNNMFPYGPFTTAGLSGAEGFNTINEYTCLKPGTTDEYEFSWEQEELGIFKWDEATETYPVIKLTFSVWLEGWDADYFSGIGVTDLAVALGFQIK